jgi:NADPH-dependent 2,4-dienoyl-CoA reductase/sulfur reductase-like enzyme
LTIARRSFVSGLLAIPFAPRLVHGRAAPRVVILGGGFGGGSLARALKRAAPTLSVTLIEREPVVYTCPFSNGVLGGMWSLDRVGFSTDALRADGIELIRSEAAAIEPERKTIVLADGLRISGDVLVLAPGIDFKWSAIEGMSPEAAELLPHAWKAGRQTQILRDQLTAMDDGGLVVVSVPAPPFRCPPGPYERISLIAHYLKQHKPASKILVLDAQDSFSKQPLFEEAWAALYPGMIERVPGTASGAVGAVHAATRRISTGFDDVTADVANVIPPQTAARILVDAGLDEGLGWCPVEPLGFESRLVKDVYILGDAALQGDMPKSGFSANVQAKACAASILARLDGRAVNPTKLINVCYSLAAPDYGFSIADVFVQGPEKVTLLQAEGRITALAAGTQVHAAEAAHAQSWYDTITSEIFG